MLLSIVSSAAFGRRFAFSAAYRAAVYRRENAKTTEKLPYKKFRDETEQ